MRSSVLPRPWGAELEQGRFGFRRVAGVAWVVLACVGLAAGISDRALIEPDEGRNAAIAWEMTQRGDYLLPHLNGLPFLDKPFLFFAAEAAGVHLFGAGEFAARLPSLLATWGAIGLTGWFASRLFGTGTGWLAALGCATAPYTIAFAGIAIFDALLSFFLLVALIGFYFAVEEEERPLGRAVGPRGWCAVAWIAMALGVLTKGPVALAIPLMVGVAYAGWRRRSAAIWRPAGWLSLGAIVGPWLWVMEMKAPGFLRYAVVTETWTRVTSDELRRTGPLWYFVPLLLAGVFPWSAIALGAVFGKNSGACASATASGGRPRLFLVLWVVLPFVMFSLSQSKRPQYLLPLVPAVALLAASRIVRGDSPRRVLRAAAAFWMVVGAGLFVVGAGWWRISFRANPEHVALIFSLAQALGAVAVVAGVVAWIGARRARLGTAALAAPFMLLPVLGGPLMGEIARSRSAKELAAIIKDRSEGPARVVAVEIVPLSLIYYLEHVVELSGATAGALTSNSILHFYPDTEAAGGTTLHERDWWRKALAAAGEPFFFLVRAENAEARAEIEAAGLPCVFVHRKWVVYGPSTPTLRKVRDGVDQLGGGPL